MAVIELTDESFGEEIGEGLVFVDFWAEWCAPCRMLSPIVEELSNEMTEIRFAKMNVEQNPMVPQGLDITGIPTLILFRDGDVLEKIVGLSPKPQLKKILEKYVS